MRDQEFFFFLLIFFFFFSSTNTLKHKQNRTDWHAILSDREYYMNLCWQILGENDWFTNSNTFMTLSSSSSLNTVPLIWLGLNATQLRIGRRYLVLILFLMVTADKGNENSINGGIKKHEWKWKIKVWLILPDGQSWWGNSKKSFREIKKYKKTEGNDTC